MRFMMIATALTAASVLAACTTTPDISHRAAQTPSLTLESYFQGKTYAFGLFEDGSGKAQRKFHVVIDGKWDGKTLTLDEDFLYDDGERQRRVWTFTRTSDGYIASAGDVVGQVEVKQSGDAASFGYLVDLKTGPDQSIRVRFADRLYLFAGDLLINRAKVTKFGVEVGDVTVVFVREKPKGFPQF
jgi:hypothetical protein